MEEVADWPDLIAAAWELDSRACEDVRDSYDYDSEINDEICNWSGHWLELYDYLGGLPSSHTGSYYERDECGEWCELNDYDFDERKCEVAEYADNRGLWDEEDSEPESILEDSYVASDEPISYEQLLAI